MYSLAPAWIAATAARASVAVPQAAVQFDGDQAMVFVLVPRGGGLIAQHLAASRPDLVDRLILIDTTPRYTDELRAMWDQRAAANEGAGRASSRRCRRLPAAV